MNNPSSDQQASADLHPILLFPLLAFTNGYTSATSPDVLNPDCFFAFSKPCSLHALLKVYKAIISFSFYEFFFSCNAALHCLSHQALKNFFTLLPSISKIKETRGGGGAAGRRGGGRRGGGGPGGGGGRPSGGRGL